MAMKQVVALEAGFYGGHRRRTGDVFQMDDAKWTKKDKGGAAKVPRWVRVVGSEAEGRSVAAKVVKEAEKHARDGVIAASGGTAAKQKVEDAAKQLAG
jgi:hypothetical protein